MNTQSKSTPVIQTVSTAPTVANHTTDPYFPGPLGSSRAVRPPAGRNGAAGPAVVLGIVSLSTSIFFIGGLLGVIGLVGGIVALGKAGPTGTGRGKAITGLVASALAIVVAVLAAVFMVWYANETQECYQPDSFHQYTRCVRQQLSGE